MKYNKPNGVVQIVVDKNIIQSHSVKKMVIISIATHQGHAHTPNLNYGNYKTQLIMITVYMIQKIFIKQLW